MRAFRPHPAGGDHGASLPPAVNTPATHCSACPDTACLHPPRCMLGEHRGSCSGPTPTIAIPKPQPTAPGPCRPALTKVLGLPAVAVGSPFQQQQHAGHHTRPTVSWNLETRRSKKAMLAGPRERGDLP